MSIHFDTIAEYDGRTDGIAITISRSACIGMLTRDNNDASLFDRKRHRETAHAVNPWPEQRKQMVGADFVSLPVIPCNVRMCSGLTLQVRTATQDYGP